MQKFKTYYIVLLLVMLLCTLQSKAQGPRFDLNWQLNSLSDDFNSGSLDLTKWCALDNCSGTGSCACWNWGGNSHFTANNTNFGVDGTKDVIKFNVDPPTINTSSPFVPIYPADTISYTFAQCCYTGGIQMVQGNNWTYGYMEISAKLPGFSASGVGHANKFWPTFWSYTQFPCSGNTVQDEIDVMDECCSSYADAETTGAGWGHTDPNNCSVTVGPNKAHTNSTPLCDDYHKFAVEWNTDRIIYYIDDVPFSEYHQDVAMNPQRVLIELQVDNNWNSNHLHLDFSPGTVFPDDATMSVDYFHYYNLRLDCSNSLTILNNAQLSSYWTAGVPAVKSDITFGNGANSISLNSSTNYVFRAVNSITINGEFIIPSGSEFTLMPSPCN